MHKLLSAYNLTAALREIYSNVAVQIIKQDLSCASAEEQQLLQLSEPQCWIREVYLQGDGANVIHARVVVPLSTYKKFQKTFDTLGNRALGESFLYQMPHTRTLFAYKQRDELWQRHSIFEISNHKILVIEYFL